MDIIFWAIALVVFITIEIMTIQLVSIWLAASAFITMLVSYFIEGINFAGQLAIFSVISAILIAITFPLMKKYRKKEYTPTNSELEIGKHAIVIEEINRITGTGRVTLNGIDWKAVSDSVIPVKSTVIVKAIDGAKLIVELTEVKQ